MGSRWRGAAQRGLFAVCPSVRQPASQAAVGGNRKELAESLNGEGSLKGTYRTIILMSIQEK